MGTSNAPTRKELRVRKYVNAFVAGKRIEYKYNGVWIESTMIESLLIALRYCSEFRIKRGARQQHPRNNGATQ